MALQIAQGGDRVTASTVDRTSRVVPQPLPIDVLTQNQSPTVTQKSTVRSEVLIAGGNLVVEKDGTITFGAQSLKSDTPITFSYKATNSKESSEIKSLELGKQEGTITGVNGYDLLSVNSTKTDGARNVFLKIGKDIEVFQIEIDGKIYIINRKEIEDIQNGKSKSSVIQLSEGNLSTTPKSIPLNPINVAKYRGLENLTLSPSGEVQFSITTNANDLLLHYARKDGSRSCSGYDTVFRHNDHYNPCRPCQPFNTRLSGATHQEGTFALQVDHLDSRTVRVDFKLDNQVVNASVKLGDKVYNIDTAELRSYIQEKQAEVTPPSRVTPPSVVSPEPDPDAVLRVPKAPTIEPSPAETTPVSPNPVVMPPVPSDAGRISLEDVPSLTEATSLTPGLTPSENLGRVAGATGVSRAVARRAEKATVGVDSSKTAGQKAIEASRELVAGIRGTPPADHAAKLEALKKLSKNQRATFKALDAEAAQIESKIKPRIPFKKGIQSTDPEFLKLENQLRANRTFKAELITEKAKLLSELANDGSNPKAQRTAQRELVRIKPEAIKAYDYLISQETAVARKTALEAKQTAIKTQADGITLSRGQRIRNLASNSADTLGRAPKFEAPASVLESVQKAGSWVSSTRPVSATGQWLASVRGIKPIVDRYNTDKLKTVNSIIDPAKTVDQLITDGFKADKAMKLDDSLAKESGRLRVQKVTGRSFSPAQQARLQSINTARHDLALKTKAVLEKIITDTASSPSEVTSAKKALFETWGQRIENGFYGRTHLLPEKTKFYKDRAAHLAETAIADRSLAKVSAIKDVSKAVALAETAVTNGGATAPSSLSKELALRKAQLERIKAEELLGRDGNGDRLKQGLEKIRDTAIKAEKKAITELQTELATELAGATPDKQPAIKERLANIENDKILFEAREAEIKVPDRKAKAVEQTKAQKDVVKAQEALAKVNNPTNTKNLLEAQEKLAKANLERLEKVEIEGNKLNKTVLETAITRLDAEIAASTNPEDIAQKTAQKKVYEKELAKQTAIETHLTNKKPLLEAKVKLSELEYQLHQELNPSTGTPVNDVEVTRIRGELETKNAEVTRLEAERVAQIQAQKLAAEAWISRKCQGIRNNPMLSLGVYTAMTEALKSAIHSDIDPNASHSWLPGLLAEIKYEPVQNFYLSTYSTTAELGEGWSRARDAVGHGIDAAGHFAVAGGAFHYGTKLVTASANRVGFNGSRSALVGRAANGAFVGYMAYTSGRDTYADGRFIDYSSDHLNKKDALDIAIPGTMNTVMGYAWAGPVGAGIAVVGAGIAVALQTVGTARGIYIALDNVDKQGKASIEKRSVFDSVDLALKGFVQPIEPGTDRPKQVKNPQNYSQEERDAITDLVKRDLFNHYMQGISSTGEVGEATAQSLSSFGFDCKLSSYSKQELREIGLVLTNAQRPKVQETNFETFSQLFSDDVGLISRETFLESLSPALKSKIESDILSLKGYYQALYNSSLGYKYESKDNSSTNYLNFMETGNEYATWLGARDTSGDWANGELNGRVDYTNHLKEYCTALSASSNFSEALEASDSPLNNNGFELINLLSSNEYLPGTYSILQTQEGFGRLLEGFHNNESNTFYRAGQRLLDFKNYSKEIKEDSEFQKLIIDINANGLYNLSTGQPDERLEKFFPGITGLMFSGQVGLNIIETVLGDDHPLLIACKSRLKEHDDKLNQVVVLPLGTPESSGATFSGGNKIRLEEAIKNFSFDEPGYYDATGFNTNKNADGSGLSEPAGLKTSAGNSWAFVRVVDDGKGKQVPVIMSIESESFDNSSDELVKLAKEVYALCSDGENVIFNQSRRIDSASNTYPKISSAQVRSDGSIYIIANEDNTTVKSYILSPKVENGVTVWRRREAHLEGNKVVLGPAT
jgi:hypothetical protein